MLREGEEVLFVGYIFFWMSWIFWVIITFFMDKTRRRTHLAILLLMAIAGANTYISIKQQQISLSFLFIIGGAFLMHGKSQKWKHYMFVSITIMIGYTAILLWEKISPIWMIIPEYLLIPFMCGMIIIVLIKDFYQRLMTGLLGICAGELLHKLILSSYHLQQPIGDLRFLDQLIILVIILYVNDLMQRISMSFVTFARSYFFKKRLQ